MKLLTTEDDIPPCCILIDLEWAGDTYHPCSTHVLQIACRNVETGDTFTRRLASLVSLATVDNTNKVMCNDSCHDEPMCDPYSVYVEWLAWLDSQAATSIEPIVLIAHNGIRFDAPVLLNSMRRYGVIVPMRLTMMDSLHHCRYYLRHSGDVSLRRHTTYCLDSLCARYGIEVAVEGRHDARYDVELLHSILCAVRDESGGPFISGALQPLHSLSTMLVKGIGPVVWAALPTLGLVEMCHAIIRKFGDLTPPSCTRYLEEIELRKSVPLANIDLIADNIRIAAQIHLQYLD